VEGAESLGLILEVSGKRFVNLRGIKSEIAAASPAAGESDATDEEDSLLDAVRVGSAFDDSGPPTNAEAAEESDARFDGPQVDRNRRVFVSHGSNRKIVEHLKELLEYGEYEPVVAVERETTSKPVPDKVLDDMRSCAAGIIHVGVERVITDASGAEFPQLNSNVLIEIGAAMALYGRNFILLVEEGTTLPSNLQGLYEVRYEGKSMDAGATMKLLKAFKDFKAD
jgi:predicted nucleotide-binding protein